MITPPCAQLYLISFLSLSWSLFGAWSWFVALMQHPAPDLFGGDCFLQLSQIWHYCILLALTLSPQVPTKKAKLRESRLQIMEDEEEPLDKYLVRNLSTFCLWSSTSTLSQWSSIFFMRYIVYLKAKFSYSLHAFKISWFPIFCYLLQTLIDFSVFCRRRTIGFNRPASSWSRRTTALHTDSSPARSPWGTLWTRYS